MPTWGFAPRHAGNLPRIMVFMPSDFSWPRVLAQLLEGKDLTVSGASEAMHAVMSGSVTDAQLAAFLIALRAKGESVEEIVGFRDAIVNSAVPLSLDPMVLDIVGTGGDPYGAVVNVSSIASIVAAAAGIPVVKHGNRAASSASGASDVLSELGLNLDLDAQGVARVFAEVGITFVFAQNSTQDSKCGDRAQRDRHSHGVQHPGPTV